MCLNSESHRFFTLKNLLQVRSNQQESKMLDLLMLAIAAGLFALTVGYAAACDRL